MQVKYVVTYTLSGVAIKFTYSNMMDAIKKELTAEKSGAKNINTEIVITK